MHALDVYWLVLPSRYPGSARVHWLDFAALLAVSGATIACGALRMARIEPLPKNDPAYGEALRYEMP